MESSHPTAPLDPESLNRINRLLEFIRKNGRPFETMMQTKERSNPNFAFLFPGGKDHAYYAFHAALADQEWRNRHPNSNSRDLTTEERAELFDRMQGTNGDQRSIEALVDWIRKRQSATAAIVFEMRTWMERQTSLECMLHILGVIDALLQLDVKRCSNVNYAKTFQSEIAAMLWYVNKRAGDRQHTRSFLDTWASKSIYDTTTIQSIEKSAKSRMDPLPPKKPVFHTPSAAVPPHKYSPPPFGAHMAFSPPLAPPLARGPIPPRGPPAMVPNVGRPMAPVIPGAHSAINPPRGIVQYPPPAMMRGQPALVPPPTGSSFLSMDHIPVGLMADKLRIALNTGHVPYTPIDSVYASSISAGPIEPARLEARVADYYRQRESSRR